VNPILVATFLHEYKVKAVPLELDRLMFCIVIFWQGADLLQDKLPIERLKVVPVIFAQTIFIK
jgi:hypothetical protein